MVPLPLQQQRAALDRGSALDAQRRLARLEAAAVPAPTMKGTGLARLGLPLARDAPAGPTAQLARAHHGPMRAALPSTDAASAETKGPSICSLHRRQQKHLRPR